MRGSGKTYIGELAARTLGWKFLDADQEFERQKGMGVREFVHKFGWPSFRKSESELLSLVLAEHPTQHVISLGGGIVETEESRKLLKEYVEKGGPVVEIVREIDEVVNYLSAEKDRPAYGEPVADVYRRRAPWFAQCSSHQFVNYTGVLQQTGLGAIASPSSGPTRHELRAEVERFFKHIAGVHCNYAPSLASYSARSYFLSLTYPDVTPALPHIDELSAGADAIELRVDLLRVPRDTSAKGMYVPPSSYVAEQLAALRSKTSLPIVFTVRTVSQGGAHPDGAEKEAFDLFDLAARMGCEYIDVELAWSVERIRSFRERCGRAQIIASWHDWSGQMKWDGAQVSEKYRQASELGDVVKIVGKALTFSDNIALYQFAENARSTPNSKPLIAVNTGYVGQFSRVLNPTLSPVTHPLLAVAAAPGQLSVAQVNAALHVAGLLPKRRFALLGTPISASPSPTLHNAGFNALGLPHHYGLHETQEVDESVKQLLRSADFGGASVTIPHKLAIMPLLDELSPHAQAIGAVNTVIVRTREGGARFLIGDNTDWIGIRDCVLTAAPTLELGQEATGLVIGAGGTARAALYALRALGINRIYLYNRTRAAVDLLVTAFPDYGIEVLERVDSFPGAPPRVVVSTVPGAATTLDAAVAQAGKGLLLTERILGAEDGGVVVDMAYRPAETPLIALASQVSATAETLGTPWACVRGVDILIAQGLAQFELWTGRRAPRRVVRENVMAFYESGMSAA